MSKVLIVGSGAFGTSICNVLLSNNHQVNIYGIDQQEINDLKLGYNKKFFHDLKLDKIPNLVTNDLKLAIKDVEFLILAIPSKFIKSFLEQYKTYINKNIIIINAAKGIEQNSKLIYPEFIRTILKDNEVASLAGPTFAIDLLQKNYSASNIASKNINTAQKVVDLFTTPYFKLVATDDEIGVCLYSALKNALAIGSGLLHGLNYSINTISAYLVMGLEQINNYVINKHGKLATILTYSAIGDTFLTCSSHKSRNFSFGFMLATNDINSLIANNTTTVEGLTIINNLYEEIKNQKQYKVFDLLYKLINNQIDKHEFVNLLWSK